MINLEMNVFGFELLKETVLPQILGKDSPEILYWVGKQVARKYPLETIDEVISFFEKANWGTLLMTKEKKSEMYFQLTSPLIEERLKANELAHFQLESGFLAQQLEHINQCVTESYEDPKKKNSVVTFQVKWDEKDIVNREVD